MKTFHMINGLCRCGCDAEVGKKSRFAQGHDARFISTLKLLAAKTEFGLDGYITVTTSEEPAGVECTIWELADRFGSPHLSAKLRKQYLAEEERSAKKAAKAVTLRRQPTTPLGAAVEGLPEALRATDFGPKLRVSPGSETGTMGPEDFPGFVPPAEEIWPVGAATVRKPGLQHHQ